MQSHRALLCDLDGTLYKPPLIKLIMGAELALFGLSQVSTIKKFREAHEALREEQHLYPKREYSPSPFEEQVRRAATATGKSEDEVRAVCTRWMVERPAKWLKSQTRSGLVRDIAKHKAGGGLAAVVSDYPATTKLNGMGLLGLFDLVIANGETKGLTRLKPAPDSYLLAASRLGVSPSECLVIGDRDDADGEAARRAGMSFRLIG